MRRPVLELSDGNGLGREDRWRTGRSIELPAGFAASRATRASRRRPRYPRRASAQRRGACRAAPLALLFDARGGDFRRYARRRTRCAQATNGNVATYVVNRNINYTNICSYRCSFCAFSKGTRKHEGAERPYLLDVGEIVAPLARGARARRHRGVPARRHPPELHGRDLSGDFARGEAGGPRHARARLLAARGLAWRHHLGHDSARLSVAAARPRVSAAFPERPQKFWTIGCAPCSVPTSSAPTNGWK